MNVQPQGTLPRSVVRNIFLVATLTGIAAALSGCCYGWGGNWGGGCGEWHGGGHWHCH